MTITASDLALYAGALFILFLTPGPVWVAVIARAATSGFQAAWPLALGVVVGDVLWPFFAILGVAWIVSVFEDFMVVLRLGRKRDVFGHGGAADPACRRGAGNRQRFIPSWHGSGISGRRRGDPRQPQSYAVLHGCVARLF